MLPWLTNDLPGCGGVFKASPEDFLVEEVPAYTPDGDPKAEHLFVWLEKRGRSTQEVAKALARHCGVEERAVSWAGLKDRTAVTRQYVCLPAKVAEPRLASFEMPDVTVLHHARHRNKLKTGHLNGNRFTLTVRQIVDQGALRACVEALQIKGLPNYYGEQRFGLANTNAAKGRGILLAGGRHRDRFERKLWLSAYQSELFNRVLARRLELGLFHRVLAGDVLKKHETGGEFVSEDAQLDQPRLDSFELSPTGPMFGPDMRQPTHEAWALEAAVLEGDGVTLDTFKAGGDETRGTRRLLRVPFRAEVSCTGDEARLQFELPAGSYATVVLREVLKAD